MEKKFTVEENFLGAATADGARICAVVNGFILNAGLNTTVTVVEFSVLKGSVRPQVRAFSSFFC